MGSPPPITAATAPGFHDGLLILFGNIPKLDAVASASLLSHAKTELSRGIDLIHSLTAPSAPAASLIGARAGSLGEVFATDHVRRTGAAFPADHFLATTSRAIWRPVSPSLPPSPTTSTRRAFLIRPHTCSRAAPRWACSSSPPTTLLSPNTWPGWTRKQAPAGLLTYIIRNGLATLEGVVCRGQLMNAPDPGHRPLHPLHVLGRNWRAHRLTRTWCWASDSNSHLAGTSPTQPISWASWPQHQCSPRRRQHATKPGDRRRRAAGSASLP